MQWMVPAAHVVVRGTESTRNKSQQDLALAHDSLHRHGPDTPGRTSITPQWDPGTHCSVKTAPTPHDTHPARQHTCSAHVSARYADPRRRRDRAMVGWSTPGYVRSYTARLLL